MYFTQTYIATPVRLQWQTFSQSVSISILWWVYRKHAEFIGCFAVLTGFIAFSQVPGGIVL